MAEELWEQVMYGDHCLHGTALGTPGGADLMCGLCEDGLTRYIEQPKFALGYTIAGGSGDYWHSIRTIPDDTMQAPSSIWAFVVDTAKRLSGEPPTIEQWRLLRKLGWLWEVRQVSSGYWVDPYDRDVMLKDFEERIRATGTGDAPASRYGVKAWVWVPVAAAACLCMEAATGETLTDEGIEHIVSLVVNDHDDIEWLIRDYGEEAGIKAEDYLT